MSRKGRGKAENDWVSCDEEVEEKSIRVGFHEQRG